MQPASTCGSPSSTPRGGSFTVPEPGGKCFGTFSRSWGRVVQGNGHPLSAPPLRDNRTGSGVGLFRATAIRCRPWVTPGSGSTNPGGISACSQGSRPQRGRTPRDREFHLNSTPAAGRSKPRRVCDSLASGTLPGIRANLRTTAVPAIVLHLRFPKPIIDATASIIGWLDHRPSC